jgi:hypothetical protein
MNRAVLVLVPALCGCIGDALDGDRRETGPTVVLDADHPEMDASFDVNVDLVTVGADTDTDDAFVDTAVPDGVTVDVEAELRVKDVQGDGTIRFLAWGTEPSDVVPEPFEFAADAGVSLVTEGFSCTNAGPCTHGRRATLDLRDGGPVTVTLQVRVTSTTDDEWKPYVSSATSYAVEFRDP